MSVLETIADVCAVVEIVLDLILIGVLLFYFTVIRTGMCGLEERITKLEGESSGERTIDGQER